MFVTVSFVAPSLIFEFQPANIIHGGKSLTYYGKELFTAVTPIGSKYVYLTLTATFTIDYETALKGWAPNLACPYRL